MGQNTGTHGVASHGQEIVCWPEVPHERQGLGQLFGLVSETLREARGYDDPFNAGCLVAERAGNSCNDRGMVNGCPVLVLVVRVERKALVLDAAENIDEEFVHQRP